jgi:hypothetical protein
MAGTPRGPPPLAEGTTTIRKVEFADAKDLEGMDVEGR